MRKFLFGFPIFLGTTLAICILVLSLIVSPDFVLSSVGKSEWRNVFLSGPLAFLKQHVRQAVRAYPPSITSLSASSIEQDTQLFHNELQAIYLTNLERRKNGIPPLRWNRELSEAAREFALDSVENRPNGYCGHIDTQGRSAGERAIVHGYSGVTTWSENVVCGFLSPEGSVSGWLGSESHRENLLSADFREVGLGYYRRTSDNRGYVVQDLAYDPNYAPVIINNEALSTEEPQIDLYIYNNIDKDGFLGSKPASEMMISNSPSFEDATWEPYATEKNWTLEGGQGWRTVYVKTRDPLGRTTIVSDSIYLGANLPLDELSFSYASTVLQELSLSNLTDLVRAGESWSKIQFSLNWMGDNDDSIFSLVFGDGERVADEDAVGGSAYHLQLNNGQTYAWMWSAEFHKNIPMVAYLRLKVLDNSSSAEAVQVSIGGGSTEYGPISIRGNEFVAANQYQEFAVPFTFDDLDPEKPFLLINFRRREQLDVFVDSVKIFTAPVELEDQIDWVVPGNYYRSRGIWARLTDDNGNFSCIVEVPLGGQLEPCPTMSASPSIIIVSPTELTVTASTDSVPGMATHTIDCENCPVGEWSVRSNAAWAVVQPRDGGGNNQQIEISLNYSNLSEGTHNAIITVEAAAGFTPTQIPVTLQIFSNLTETFLPIARR